MVPGLVSVVVFVVGIAGLILQANGSVVSISAVRGGSAVQGATTGTAGRNLAATGVSSPSVEVSPLPTVKYFTASLDCPSLEAGTGYITGTYKVDMSTGSLRYFDGLGKADGASVFTTCVNLSSHLSF